MKTIGQIDPLGVSDVDFQLRHIPVDENVSLEVMSWTPDNIQKPPILFFVAGYVSVIDGWLEFLRVIVPSCVVYYVETREKSSASIQYGRRLTPDDFSVYQLAMDIISTMQKLDIDPGRTIVGGSSLGATVLFEALKNDGLHAKGAFMIGPNSEFKAPWFIREVLLNFPAQSYHVLKYFMLWYLKTFRVDARKEPEQWTRYYQTLMTANPYRLKLSAKAAVKYTIWKDLKTIDCPVIVLCAATDKLHNEQNIHRIVSTLPAATKLVCPSNKYMHSAELGHDFNQFVKTLLVD